MTETPLFLLNVFKAASIKLDHFVNTSFAENIQWLREIEEEAKKAFGSASITLLPKTPSMKRKRPDIIKANDNNQTNETISKHASTFVDGVKTKKLKIDDMSAIVENAADTTVTMIDKSDTSILKKGKQTRKKKISSQTVKRSKRLAAKTDHTYYESPNAEEKEESPVKRSTRLAVKTDISYYESPVEKPTTAKENGDVVIINDTPDVPLSSSSSIVCSSPTTTLITSPNVNSVIVSPVLHVQPKVAVLIEKLRLTAHKSGKKTDPYQSPNSEEVDEVRMTLFPTDELSSPEKQSSVKDSDESPVKINTKESTPINKQMHADNLTMPNDTTSTANTESSVEPNVNQCSSFPEEDEDPVGFTKITTKADAVDVICSLQFKPSSVCQDSPILIAEKKDVTVPALAVDGSGRRDTYKVVVMEKELPKKSTPKQILTNVNTYSMDIESPGLNEDPEPTRKGPRIFKPIKAGNIATGIKSFLKKVDTPKKETEQEKQQKKAAELERKENNRMKAIEETHLKRQKLLEERKKLKIQREKEFAERQARRQKEEEEKRLQLEMKAKQVFKNRELLKKKKEVEEKKKREVREMKIAEANARRQREEEEHKRRVLEQIEEENKRQEMLQRKAEYEEQERLKKKMENERAEKERLRLIEEDRLLSDERKKREYEEKERHRLEVERKLKEEREKERLEKQKREDRMKQAEKEIEEARKHELERERAKLRDEIRAQINQEKLLKGNQFNPKVVINAQAGNRSSPRLAGKENFKPPSATAMSVKSPAAYNLTKPQEKYNPPRVPLMIRDSSYCCYPIDDLGSDDSTDDEAEPAKRVPSWAQGINLKTQLMQQFYTNIDPDLIFINCMEPCRLDKIFQKKKERYFKRTSSAHWTSPIMKSKVLP